MGLNKGVDAIVWDLNKCVVQYFWLKQGCDAILSELNKGVLQYL